SNLLIDQGHVFFSQADGSLTVLSLETGDVLHRDKARAYSGTFTLTPAGILVVGYDFVAVLNQTNFTRIWSADAQYDAIVSSNLLVSYDGYGLVQCRKLTDGSVQWTFNLPGALQIVPDTGLVLVHRAATYEEKSIPTTVGLDLQSGKELFRKTAPPNTHWEKIFFDGTN